MNTYPNTITPTTRSTTATQTRLSGQWLLFTRLAWTVLSALCIGAYVVARVAILRDPQLLARTAYASIAGDQIWQFWVPDLIVSSGYMLSGLFLMWRGSRDWLAMTASYALIGMGTAVLNDTGGLLLAMSDRLLWLVVVTGSVPTVAMVTLIFTLPDGRFVPRWTRWLVLASVPHALLLLSTYYDFPKLSDTLDSVILAALVAILLAGLGSQAYRYRRVSGPTQRQQTKWVLLGFLTFTTDIIMSILIYEAEIFGDPATLYVPAVVAFVIIIELGLPASIVFSILRFRLWDIDYIINRSLVYGALVAVLLGLFAGTLFAVSRLFQGFSGGPIVAVAVSAAVFGLLFNPLNRRLRAFVDHRLYNIGIEYATVATGPRRLPVRGLDHIGQYTDLEPIGSGGMAEVYRSQHPTLNHPVAVKVLPERLAEREEFRRRFEREAQVVAGLKHPHIVQMYDFGEEDGIYFMVMEYVDGATLSQVIREGGRMPIEQVSSIVRDVASALDYAHQQGLVHRDIKPSNVMVAGGRAVLMDFGIARIASAMTQLTGTGGMVGTPDYISPEQIRDAKDVDGRADVYSLGVMAFHMLTGEVPFRKSSAAALVLAHLMEPPPDPRDRVPNIPSAAAHGIMRAMAKDPQARFETAGQLAESLTAT